MTNHLFSIITVTLNHLDGLRKTAGSITQQSCKNYEWIVIDGASNDGTQDYLQQIKANYISEKDNGIFDAMNKGIDRAQGKYLIFMNAGDCFADYNVLHDLEIVIRENQPDFLYGDALEITAGKITGKKSRDHTKISQGMFTHHQAMIYKHSIVDNDRYSIDYIIAADYDFTRRYLKKCAKIIYLPIPVCLFESGGISQQQVLLGRKEQFLIRRRAGTALLVNGILFIGQSLFYNLRKILPSLYWHIKRPG